MTMSFSDILMLAILLLTAVSIGAPQIAGYLAARKADRLSKVVAAGGRLAAIIVGRLRALPPGVSPEAVKADLIAEAVSRLKSPDLFGDTIKKSGYADAGLKNVIEGQVAQLEIVASPAETIAAPALDPVLRLDSGIPLTPETPPTPYPPAAPVAVTL